MKGVGIYTDILIVNNVLINVFWKSNFIWHGDWSKCDFTWAEIFKYFYIVCIKSENKIEKLIIFKL